MKKLFFITAVLFFAASVCFAQDDIGSKLNRMGQQYTSFYLKPLNYSLSALNSGFFDDANVPFSATIPIGFHFKLSFKGFATFITSDDQVFNMTYVDSITVNNQMVPGYFTVTNAPTVFGSKTPPIATGYYYDPVTGVRRDTTQETIGGVLYSKVVPVPMVVPQLEIGHIYGTDITFRGFPKIDFGSLGKIGYFGVALRHNVSHYFTKIPFDFGVQAGYQNVFVKDKNDAEIVNFKTFFANVQASKSISIFIIYGGLQYEDYNSDVTYTYSPFGSPYQSNISYKLRDSYFKGILGGTLTAGLFRFNPEMSVARRFMMSFGIGVGQTFN